MASSLASKLLFADALQDGWFEERISHLHDPDRRKVRQAMMNIAEDLRRYGDDDERF